MTPTSPPLFFPKAWGLLTTLLLLLLSSYAQAASLRTEVGARTVGVGQTFEVRVTAVQDEGDPEPTAPQLKISGKAQVRGPSVGSQRRVSMKNFSFESETSVIATWHITPSQVGKLIVGPGSFQVGSKRLAGEQVVIDVVEQARAQPRRRQSPFSRFGSGQDPFGDDPFDMFSRRTRTIDDLPALPEEYAVEKAENASSFLIAHLDKDVAVLGEPVRLVIFAYSSQGNFQEAYPQEPSLADFLSYSVVESSHDEAPYRAEIQGSLFIARKLREFIIVPLRTGDLAIGEMTAVLQIMSGGFSPQGRPQQQRVRSPSRILKVVDAPVFGRPPGFVPGDVGDFRLQASLSPRNLKVGEFSELVVNISGRGQLPSQVLLPEGKEFTWDPPTIKGGPEVQDGELQGTRVLKFPLQVKTAGTIELGQLRLPFFDPQTGRYRVEQVDLGNVRVEDVPEAPARDAQEKEGRPQPLKTAEEETISFEPRTKADPFVAGPRSSIPSYLWVLLFGLPAFIALGGVARGAFMGMSQRRAQTKKNAARDLLIAARKELSAGNEAKGLGLIEKGIYEALDHATSQRNRGVLRSELAAHLTTRGLSSPTAEQAQHLLESCEIARYGSAKLLPQGLLEESEKLVLALQKFEKKAKGKAGVPP